MKNLIIANWKMHPKSESIAGTIVDRIKKDLIPIVGIDLVICPPAVYLPRLYEEVRLTSIKLGVQNVDFRDSGAFTGEISVPMIKKWARYALVGHSERREIFGEDDKTINKKIIQVLAHGLHPILCVGEKIKDVRMGESDSVMEELSEDLKNVGPREIEKVVIAYEPIWAIGKVKGADPSYANQQIGLIRQAVASFYNRDIATRMRILYGGSVNSGSILEYIDQPEINGALVGHQSIKAREFVDICKAAMGK
jgi:triosephosphate isomerase